MNNTITRISSLEEHRNILKSVFETARNRVLVVSPFITKSALDHDRVPDLVHKATRRGVFVDIYTDEALNLDSTGNMKTTARSGVDALLMAGAHVTVVQGIHNKTLAKDNDLIAEGSFNWLSAVRTTGGTHQREERTMVVRGEQARGMIMEEESKLKGMASGKHLKTGSTNNRKSTLKATILWFVFSYISAFCAWHRLQVQENLVGVFSLYCLA